MFKRIITLSLLAMASLDFSAQTTFVTDGVTYTVKNGSEVELTSADSEAKKTQNLIIPTTVTDGTQSYTVTSIAAEAYQWSDATSITVPGSVKTIGAKAFYHTSPTSITLEEGIQEIGSYAFTGKTITELDIPGSVKKIGDHAFFGTTSKSPFQKLTLHEGLEEIGDAAFYGNAIEELHIPGTCKVIGNTAFLYSTKLKTLTFGEGVEEIGEGAFQNGDASYNKTTELTSVTLPSSLKKIGMEAFLRMPLTSINIPASLETLGESAFAKTDITTITVAAGNKNFKLMDGNLYSKNGEILYLIPMKGVTELKVKNGCRGIYGGACWGSEVKKVTLPQGIVALSYGAFLQTPLEEINLPNSISYIDDQCFAGTNLTSVTLPENLYHIYEGTFAQCEKLKSVVIPSSVAAIDVRAFIYSNNLSSVTCLGSVPPYLVEANEYEEVFTSTFTLYVPKGCADAYKAKKIGNNDNYWSIYYNKVQELETGVLSPVSVSPVIGSELEKTQAASFEILFDEPITLVNEAPEVGLRVSAPYNAAADFCEGWKALVSNNKLTVFAYDMDGFTMGFATQPATAYYVTIPAGIVKNAAGDLNEHILLGYVGNGTNEVLPVETTVFKGDRKAVANYNLNGQQTSRQKKGIQIVRYSDGSTRKVLVK